MIQVWLLRVAAARWRDDGRMLAEWRAEMSIMDNGWDRLRFALSLAASRPHHLRAHSLPRHTIPATLASFVFLLVFPFVETMLHFHWLASLAAFGAIALAAVFARATAALTNLIKPSYPPAWVFGVQAVFILALADTLSSLITLSLWLAGGVASGMVVVRLTRRGRTAIAWTFIAVAASVLLLLPFGPILVDFPYILGYPDVEAGRILFALATSPFLHLALFGLVYVRGLATAAVKLP